MPKTLFKFLSELEPGEAGEVVELCGGERFVQRMRSMGIKEGSKIKVIASMGFGGPVVVKSLNSRITIGRGMTKKIKVKI